MKHTLPYMIIMALSCLSFGMLKSQNLNRISGVVVDENREPVDYVYIFAENDGILKETFTNPAGEFELMIGSGTCKLKGVYFSKILFEKELTIVSDFNLDTLYVSPDLSLSEVMVEAPHNLVSFREDKLLFDVRKLSRTEGYNANDVLKYVPKVIVDFNGQIHVGSKQAAVYLNNRRLSSEEITMTLNSLQAKDISEIEVQSTHGGEYGAEIQGGVIHIILHAA
jgi:hypothetical protein